MRLVYDNIIFSLQDAGGISVYWAELIKHLVRTSADVTFYGASSGNRISRELPIRTISERRAPQSVLRYLPFTRRLAHGTLFHSSYYRVALQKHVRNVVTVHDFTYERLERGLRKSVHILQKRLALLNADGVICVSENTREDLMEFYPGIRVPVAVISHGVSDGFVQLSQAERERELEQCWSMLLRKRFVLFVGARSHYKNFALAVEAVAALDDSFYFAFVGGGPLTDEHAELLDRTLRGRYVHCLGIGERELNTLYNCAYCLIYPSSYEGFGLPLIEAMRAGCPVVAVRVASVPEVVGDAALLAEDALAVLLTDKLSTLENEHVRRQIVAKGLQRASEFSWATCFERTHRFYEQIGDQGGR